MTSFVLALFTYVLVRPVSNNQVLVPVLLALFVVVWLLPGVPRTRLRSDVKLAFVLVIWIGALYSAFGGARGNPGYLYGAVTFVAGPALFLGVARSADLRWLKRLLSFLPWIVIYLSVGIIYTVMDESGIGPEFGLMEALFIPIDQGSAATSVDGLLAVRFYGISSLALLLPGMIWLAGTAASTSKADSVRAVIWGPALQLSVVLGVAAALVSGRRGIAVAVVGSILITLFAARSIRRGLRVRRRRGGRTAGFRYVLFGITLVLGLVVAFKSLGLDPVRYLASIGEGFDSSGDDGFVRTNQISRLIDEFARQPLTGHGLGATIEGYSRSSDRPWNFETQYPLYLFNFGILGITVMLTAVVVAAGATLKRWRMAGNPNAIYLGWSVVTALSALILNGTNPYLQAIGHQWALFCPLIVCAAIDAQSIREKEESGGGLHLEARR